MKLGERIRVAVEGWVKEHRDHSHRAFAREMQRRGLRGGSYRSLLNYMSGTYKPSGKWIEEAADVTGVAVEWLADGTGPRGAQRTLGAGSAETDVVALFRSCAPEQVQEHADLWLIASWFMAVRAIADSASDAPSWDEDAMRRIGLWLILHATVPALLLDREWDRTQFNHYYNLIFTAVAAAAPPPGTGVPLSELVEKIVGAIPDEALSQLPEATYVKA